MSPSGSSVVHDAEHLVARCRQLSQKVGIYSKKFVNESDTLTVEVKSLLATTSSIKKQLQDLPEERSNQVQELLSEAHGIITGLGPGGDLRRLCAPKYPFLLRVLLGKNVPAVTLRKEQAIAIREDYHAFRSRAVWIMFFVPLMLYLGMKRADSVSKGTKYHHSTLTLTPPLLTGFQAYLAWLAYFYVAMALRECVLLLNGSHIKPWWITHHYWSAGVSLIMLALPVSSPTVYRFSENFMLWSCFQALVMLVQNLYQRRRMYTRIALGKNNAMDVVSGESSGSSGQLLLLYPLLLALQGWQLFIGLDVASQTWPAMINKEGWLEQEPSQSDLRGMRGTFISGCLFAYMSVRNFIATITTITEKQKYRKRKRATVGGAEGAAAAAAGGSPGAGKKAGGGRGAKKAA